jgi:hypothetical protein
MCKMRLVFRAFWSLHPFLPLKKAVYLDGGARMKRVDVEDEVMDRLREIFLYGVAALALFALLGAVYQAMNRQNGSGLTLGAIFGRALIVFIPQVLKAWGIEARLTKTLDRAEEFVGRRLSAISAKATYMQMTWVTGWVRRLRPKSRPSLMKLISSSLT